MDRWPQGAIKTFNPAFIQLDPLHLCPGGGGGWIAVGERVNEYSVA